MPQCYVIHTLPVLSIPVYVTSYLTILHDLLNHLALLKLKLSPTPVCCHQNILAFLVFMPLIFPSVVRLPTLFLKFSKQETNQIRALKFSVFSTSQCVLKVCSSLELGKCCCDILRYLLIGHLHADCATVAAGPIAHAQQNRKGSTGFYTFQNIHRDFMPVYKRKCYIELEKKVVHVR